MQSLHDRFHELLLLRAPAQLGLLPGSANRQLKQTVSNGCCKCRVMRLRYLGDTIYVIYLGVFVRDVLFTEISCGGICHATG